MVTTEYEDWLARGRAHQAQGRAIDAMLCFRRALRADRDASDARFHLGEVLWQLGRLPAAIAAWRDGTSVNAGHLAPNLALAEALLATGDAAAAGARARGEGALQRSSRALSLRASPFPLGEGGWGDRGGNSRSIKPKTQQRNN